MTKDIDLSLYLVTDRELCCGDFLETIHEAVKGGVTIVQLREKDCSTREFIELGIKVKEILSPYNVPLIINDRVDVAMAVDAEGVHLGQSDMPYQTARELLGEDKIIGLSLENLEQVEPANQLQGLDYVAVSPIFSTPTKEDTAPEFGLNGARKVVELSHYPVVAIGGIHPHNLEQVMGSGVSGVAVVSAIVSTPEPCVASQELASIIKRAKK